MLGAVIGYALTGSATGAGVAVVGALILSVVLSAGAWFGGDGLVLAASQAKQVGPGDAPQLINVVQEMALAAGIPMPKVYLINDTAPNAFATGRDPQHASVAVTSGLLDKLDREELQGVLGHELSHVRNYDIRFALLVGVLVGSIALLADMFLRFIVLGQCRRPAVTQQRLRRRPAGRADGRGLVLAILAPFFARMVQLAVSRQREYLADASSVELTRNPVGLERALATISADTEPLEVANRATQHLYIVNPIKKLDDASRGLFSTHPPIRDRIDRLRALSGEPPLDSASAQGLAGLD